MSDELTGVDLTKAPEPKQPEENEETKQEEEKKEEEKTLGDVLAAFAGAPDEATIETWKTTHGEVLCSGFSETELFVFRPITRDEFVNLQMHIANAQEQISNFAVEQKIVETCLLWASPPGVNSLEKKAGSLSTLHEQILQASNFINPAYASQFVMKL